MIIEKALVFYEKIKRTDSSTSKPKVFDASNGWLTLFLKRTNLHNVQIRGESASADEEACANYSEQFKNIIESGWYSPEQVFNAEERQTFFGKKNGK